LGEVGFLPAEAEAEEGVDWRQSSTIRWKWLKIAAGNTKHEHYLSAIVWNWGAKLIFGLTYSSDDFESSDEAATRSDDSKSSDRYNNTLLFENRKSNKLEIELYGANNQILK